MSHVRAIEDLFGELIELESPEERQQNLDRVGSDDPRLRAQLERLVADHERAGSFLQVSEPAAATEELFSSHRLGAQIGPYKLREQIGEGGMGTVYVAEQQQPLRRKVALKVIKPGMDSKAVIARFEAERNALALMDHPNIAKVLDAGTTEQGRPYFVMELVKGIPVTEYCDEHKLTIRERLELFVTICQAIQHAHQKGIIHRDIKPSNVLITELDGKPIPKVIDFGVAKALNQTLTERSIYTSFQAVIGTPLYMSPEQASLSAVDVDTRSDVYSLGVLLYELLTGTTPFDLQELKKVAQDEVLRFIREQEPPRPSNRLSTLGDTATRISQARRTEPDQLGRQVKGDLDWIVMRALEKERARRYKTADALATDIERHLGNEPVEARPPSPGYRLSRFYRRNKVGVAVATAFVLLLSLTVIVTTTAWISEIRQRRLAETRLGILKDFVMVLSMSPDADDVRLGLQIAELSQMSFSWQQMMQGTAAMQRGEMEEAIDYLNDGTNAASDPDALACKGLLAYAHLLAGNSDEYDDLQAELLNSELRTPEEYLFVGRAFLTDPMKWYSSAECSFELRESPLSRLNRAEASRRYALDTDKMDLIRQAVSDIARVKLEVPENPYVIAASLMTNHAALQIAIKKGEMRHDFQSTADADVQRLRQVPDYGFGLLVIAGYLDNYGSREEADRAWTTVLSDGNGGWHDIHAAAMLFRLGDVDRARQYLKGDQTLERIALGMVLCSDPQGCYEALEIYRSLPRRTKPVHFMLGAEIDLLVSVGDLELLRGEAKKLAALGFRTLYDEYAIKYLSGDMGDIEAKEFIRNVNGSNTELLMAHFMIGRVCHARDDSRGAIGHFEQAVATGVYHTSDYYWAKAYLSQLEEDESGVPIE